MKLCFLFYFILLFFFQEISAIEPLEKKEPLVLPPISDYFRPITSSGKSLKFHQTLQIWVGGDVMFNWGVRDSIRSEDPLFAFRSFQPLLGQMDFALVNLETPVLRKKPPADKIKSYVFYAEESNLQILKSIGVKGVFLGNNHAMDFGGQGLEETIQILKEQKFRYAGAGKNLREAISPMVWKKGNSEFHFYSASEIGEARLFASPNQPGVNPLRVQAILQEKSHWSRGKIPILSLHWGVEYSPEPTDAQRKIAQELVRSGFPVVLGHHPHVPQGIEVFPEGVVVYSLGNFFFGSKNSYLKHNITVVLHFRDQKLQVLEVIPVYGKHQDIIGELYFEPLTGEEAEVFLKEYSLLCEKLGTELLVQGGRGYVFFDKERKAREKKN